MITQINSRSTSTRQTSRHCRGTASSFDTADGRDEYEQAVGGQFPDRATWLLAREIGILTYKKYLDHKAEKKALDSLGAKSEIPKVSVEEHKSPFIATKPIKTPQTKKEQAISQTQSR